MQTAKNISFLLLAVIFIYSCKKSDLKLYDEPDMVYVYQNAFDANRDSISYSFAIKAATLTADTIKIPLRIMGVARDKDRTVGVRVVTEGTTAKEGQDFTLLPAVIKANEYTGYIPVLVKRTAGMKTSELRLIVEVIESADFKPGVPASAPQSPRAGGRLTMLVKMNDFLTKPSNWDSLLTFYFGSFSQVKFAFVIQVTGRSEFLTSGADPVSSPQLTYYKILCKNALAVYNASHPPLTDEFGLAVTFPN